MPLFPLMSTRAHPLILAAGLVLTPAAAQPPAVAVAPAPESRLAPLPPSADPGRPLPLRIGGRVVGPAGSDPLARYRRQWPGTYIEAAFRGPAATLAIGPGEVSLRVRVDGGAPVALVRPAPGLYRIPASGSGAHRVRIDVVSESQAGATAFGGLYAPPGTQPLPAPPPRARRIEFIGDSHTVGYGNTAATTTCSEAQVWATTDTSQGPAAVTATRYGADYRVNAISGRGIVRNYGGMAATTLPDAYPFALFDGSTRAQDDGWRPQVIVISLGTNDFSTALTPGERWPTRAALHADYEQRYVAFVQALRRRDPRALVVLWATDMADGEIAREVGRVAARLRTAGDSRVAAVTVPGLRFTGCHAHPDLADARTIAAAIGGAIDARADAWGGR